MCLFTVLIYYYILFIIVSHLNQDWTLYHAFMCCMYSGVKKKNLLSVWTKWDIYRYASSARLMWRWKLPSNSQILECSARAARLRPHEWGTRGSPMTLLHIKYQGIFYEKHTICDCNPALPNCSGVAKCEAFRHDANVAKLKASFFFAAFYRLPRDASFLPGYKDAHAFETRPPDTPPTGHTPACRLGDAEPTWLNTVTTQRIPIYCTCRALTWILLVTTGYRSRLEDARSWPIKQLGELLTSTHISNI